MAWAKRSKSIVYTEAVAVEVQIRLKILLRQTVIGSHNKCFGIADDRVELKTINN